MTNLTIHDVATDDGLRGQAHMGALPVNPFALKPLAAQ